MEVCNDIICKYDAMKRAVPKLVSNSPDNQLFMATIIIPFLHCTYSESNLDQTTLIQYVD